MANGTGGAAVAPQPFSDDDVLEASFRVEAATEGTEPARKLFLQTYRLANAQARTWHAMPEEDWPLLATILPNRIIMRPIHVNPHAQRYLTPKNGRFTTVIYVDDYGDELLDDANALTSYLPEKVADSIRWKTNESILFGAGNGVPIGALTAGATVTVAKESGQATQTLLPQNLAKMISRLPTGSFARSVWVMSTTGRSYLCCAARAITRLFLVVNEVES